MNKVASKKNILKEPISDIWMHNINTSRMSNIHNNITKLDKTKDGEIYYLK